MRNWANTHDALRNCRQLRTQRRCPAGGWQGRQGYSELTRVRLGHGVGDRQPQPLGRHQRRGVFLSGRGAAPACLFCPALTRPSWGPALGPPVPAWVPPVLLWVPQACSGSPIILWVPHPPLGPPGPARGLPGTHLCSEGSLQPYTASVWSPERRRPRRPCRPEETMTQLISATAHTHARRPLPFPAAPRQPTFPNSRTQHKQPPGDLVCGAGPSAAGGGAPLLPVHPHTPAPPGSRCPTPAHSPGRQAPASLGVGSCLPLFSQKHLVKWTSEKPPQPTSRRDAPRTAVYLQPSQSGGAGAAHITPTRTPPSQPASRHTSTLATRCRQCQPEPGPQQREQEPDAGREQVPPRCCSLLLQPRPPAAARRQARSQPRRRPRPPRTAGPPPCGSGEDPVIPRATASDRLRTNPAGGATLPPPLPLHQPRSPAAGSSVSLANKGLALPPTPAWRCVGARNICAAGRLEPALPRAHGLRGPG